MDGDWARRRRLCPSLFNRCWETGRAAATTSTGMMARLQDSCSGIKKTNRMPFVLPGWGSLRALMEVWTGRTSEWEQATSPVQRWRQRHHSALVLAGLSQPFEQRGRVCSSCFSTSVTNCPLLCWCSWTALCC